MNRFGFDVLDDREEEDQETYEQELISRRGIPAYATDEQRKQLMLWLIDQIDEVMFTNQRLQVEQSKDCVTIRRLLGGAYNPETHGDPYRVPSSGLKEELNEEH